MMWILGRKKRSKKEVAVAPTQESVFPAYDIVVSVQTDPGCVRESNEDSGRFIRPNDPAVLESKGVLTIVADGMGGHASGEVASQMAVELISRIYYQDDRCAAEALEHAVEEANRLIYEASLTDERLYGMGTTCTALVLFNGSALAAHVGDSRLYMIRGGELYRMTEDHSAVVEMVKQGVLNLEEAHNHTDKNVILRALGTAPEVEISIWEKPFTVRDGDHFILCSDGLYDLVEDATIAQVVVSALDPHAACEHLIALAKERGGHDNITVGVISIKPAGYAANQIPRATREYDSNKMIEGLEAAR
jgi:PPM family protein phosphatase